MSYITAKDFASSRMFPVITSVFLTGMFSCVEMLECEAEIKKKIQSEKKVLI